MGTRRPELFFISPFGMRTTPPGLGLPSSIDFDRIYQEAVAPACDDRGWIARRGDAPFGAPVMDAIIELLYRADLVVADVSMPNANVFYELGLRHSLSAGATLVIAHQGTTLPFDIAHRQALLYEQDRLADLRAAIGAVLDRLAAGERPQSPFRDALERMGVVTGSSDRVAFEQDLNARIQRAENNNQLIAVWQWARAYPELGIRQLAVLAKRLAAHKNWSTAAEVLERACAEAPNDFEMRRMHGWVLRKLGRLDEAERELREALRLNDADPEALAILGAILKGPEARRAEAREVYKRAKELSPEDNYVLVNLAAVELLLSPREPSEAKRLYRELLDRLEKRSVVARDVWDDLMIGEACFVLEDDERAWRHFAKAALRPECTWEIDSALDQLALFAAAGYRPEQVALLGPHIRDQRQRSTGPVERKERPGSELPRARPPAAGPVLLHLSDLHFGERAVAGGTPQAMHRFGHPGSPKTLLEHLQREFSCGHPGRFSFDAARLYVVVSGDITYGATEAEFEAAREFLEGLCASLGVAKDRVAMAPGNHDVNWAAAAYKASSRFDDYLIFLKKFYGEDVARRLYPRIDWALSRNAVIDPSDIFSVYTSADQAVQLVTLNSCVHESEANHWGFVGEAQLERIGDVLEGVGGDAVKVAVLHHHIHPYPEHHPPEDKTPWLDISLIRDGGAVEAWLEDRSFDVVLHGHKHKPQLRQTVVRGTPQVRRDVRPLIVCGAGSAGVHERELPHAMSNQYQVLEILRVPRMPGADFLRICWRELATFSGAKWMSPQDPWVLTG